MIKFKKKHGFPFDIDITLKEINSDKYAREVIMVDSGEVLAGFSGDFTATTDQSKQYVNGLFDGYKLGRKE